MKYIFLAFTLVITACSKSNNSSKPSTDPVIGESQSIVILTNSELDSEVVNFGVLKDSNAVSTRRITIENRTLSAISLTNLKLAIEGFNTISSPDAIVVNRDFCSNKTLPANKSCILDVTVKYNPEIVWDSPIELTNNSGSSPTISFYAESSTQIESDLSNIASALVVQNSNIDFGVLAPGAVIVKRLYILNTKTVDSAGISLPVLPAGVSVIRNTCSDIVRKLSSCFIDVKYEYQGDELNETIVLSGNIFNKNINLDSTKVIEIADNAPKLLISYIDFPVETTTGVQYSRRIFVKNIQLSSNYQFLPGQLSSQLTSATTVVLNNTCDSRLIKAGKSCFVDLRHVPVSDNQFVSLPIVFANANVSEIISIGQSGGIILDNRIQPAQALFDGGLHGSGLKEINVVFNNTGTRNYSGLTVDGVVAPFSVKNNGCSSLSRRGSCTVVLEVSAADLTLETPYNSPIKLINSSVESPSAAARITALVTYSYSAVIKPFGTTELPDNFQLTAADITGAKTEFGPVVNPISTTNPLQAGSYGIFLEVRNRSTKQIAQSAPTPVALPLTYSFSSGAYQLDTAPTTTAPTRIVSRCGFPGFAALAADSSCSLTLRINEPNPVALVEEDKEYTVSVNFGVPLASASFTVNNGRLVKNPSDKFIVAMSNNQYDASSVLSNMAGALVPSADHRGALIKMEMGSKNIQTIGSCFLNAAGAQENLFAAPGSRTNSIRGFGIVPYVDSSGKGPVYKASNGKIYFVGRGCSGAPRVMDFNYSMWEYDPTQAVVVGVNPKQISNEPNKTARVTYPVEGNGKIFFQMQHDTIPQGPIQYYFAIYSYDMSSGVTTRITLGEDNSNGPLPVGGNGMVFTNGKLYFVSSTGGQNGLNGVRLLSYDPSLPNNSTTNPAPVVLAPGSISMPAFDIFTTRQEASFIAAENKLIFMAAMENHSQFKPYVYDLNTNILSAINNVSGSPSSLIRYPGHMTYVGNGKVIMTAFIQTTPELSYSSDGTWADPSVDGEDRIVVLDLNTLNARADDLSPQTPDLYHDFKSFIRAGNFTSSVYHRPYNTSIAVLNGVAYFRTHTSSFVNNPTWPITVAAGAEAASRGALILSSYNSSTDTFRLGTDDFYSFGTSFSIQCSTSFSNAACATNTTLDDQPFTGISVIGNQIAYRIRTFPPTGTTLVIYDPSQVRTDSQSGQSIYVSGSNPYAKYRAFVSGPVENMGDGRLIFTRSAGAGTNLSFPDAQMGTGAHDMPKRIQTNFDLPQSIPYQIRNILGIYPQ